MIPIAMLVESNVWRQRAAERSALRHKEPVKDLLKGNSNIVVARNVALPLCDQPNIEIDRHSSSGDAKDT